MAAAVLYIIRHSRIEKKNMQFLYSMNDTYYFMNNETYDQIELDKSTIGAIPKHRATVEALGLKKLHKTVELPNNAATKGMLQQVRHLVKVEEV